MDVSQLPFNNWLGLTLCDDKVCLQPAPQHLNHIGTVHAAVIFAVAEAAAGHWLSRRYPDLGQSHLAVLRQSKVKYRQPAAREIELTGTATCDADVAHTFLETLYDRGRAVLDVSAVVEQAGTGICQTDLRWFATKRSDASP